MNQPHDENLPESPAPAAQAPRPYADHSRHWDTFAYVYPVVSRRSKGLSIGVNLNPDTICNFDCVYCQVDKIEPPRPVAVDMTQLGEELNLIIDDAVSGRLWEHAKFKGVAPSLRRLNDIAFSGDGEPTAATCFAQAVDIVVAAKRKHQLDDTRLVVITNATLLDRPGVESALRVLDAHGGEVWAKLDAGTEAYYEKIDRSAVPLHRVLENILACGRRRPIIIQSMCLKMHGEPVPADEFDAYGDRLAGLIEAGCRIKLVQLYTVARKPLEDYVSALSDPQLTELAHRLTHRLAKVTGGHGVPVEVYGAGG